MEHYYTRNSTAEHDERLITFNIGNRNLEFISDSGVFSKDKIDFGSELMIRSIPKLEGSLLDLGCGYGPIGISLSTMNEGLEVLMVDINERAVSLANRNVAKNNISKARAIQSDGFENVEGLFNTIVTNPPIRTGKKNIYDFFEKSVDYLMPNGRLYIVIQKKQGAPSAEKKLIELFGNCGTIAKKGGYFIFECTKKA